MTRSRTTEWEDPAPLARAGHTLRGLDLLHAIGRGDLPAPPMMRTLGIEPVEVEEGRAAFAVLPGEHHYNPLGMAHGGLAATLMDTALGCAVHSVLPAGSAYTTLDLKVSFVRPITAATGRVVAEARTIHVGSRVATAEARVVDGAGKLYAHGTATCMIVPVPGGG